MDDIFTNVLEGVAAGTALVSALHALLKKDDPRSALVWVALCLMVPLAGPFLYWSLGVNRIHRKGRAWRETGRRLAASDIDRRSGAAPPPPGAEPLAGLRMLGDRITGTHPIGGNDVTLLENGEKAYPAMLAAIAAATDSINMSTYIFDGDLTGRQFAAALAAAAERGVEVRVLIDALGEKYSFPRGRSHFKGSRVKVARYLPLRQEFYINLRNHRKLLVVDGRVGFTGGMNIGDRHLVTRARKPVADLHFRVEGPATADLQAAFAEDWHFSTREILAGPRFFPPIPPCGPAVCRGVADGPDREVRTLHWLILGALAAARREVRIMTPYLIPESPLMAALSGAALRGVAVTILLPGLNNLPYVRWASTTYLPHLLGAGIRIALQPPPFVHTKLLTIDGEWSLVGSANLDPRSLRLNFEFCLEVSDREFAALLTGHFDRAWSRSAPVTPEELDNRPLPLKIRDGMAKLFSPYL